MNVTKNYPFRPPRRGGLRGQNSGKQRTPNILPKYDLDSGFRRPLVNMVPIDVNTARTPASRYRRRGTTSSSLLRTSTRYGSSTSRNAAGTMTSSTPSIAANSAVIIAITEGRGDAKGEVGIAAVDANHPHLILCQMSDLQTYMNTLTKIHLFQPVEILMPATMNERSVNSSKLYQLIKNKFEGVNITAISRRHFSDAIGLDLIRNLCAVEYSSVELFVKQKFYALAAAAALLKYVEFIQHIIYTPKSMRIEFQCSEDSTVIDIESATSLELVALHGNARDYSLLSSLDQCSTPGGKRHLRASILQPPCNEDVIQERQKCVAEMVTHSTLLSGVQSVVHRLYGVDRLLTLSMSRMQNDNIQRAERNLNYVLLLKSSLEIIPSLQAALQNTEADFFGKVKENLRDPRYKLILEKILENVQPEARSVMGFTSANMQRCFALKSGVNSMLDIARQTYCELIDDLKSAVEQLAEKYNYPLTLGCSAMLGYHIQMDVPKHKLMKITDLPMEFIEVQKQKNCYCMTTSLVLVMNQRCKDACEELHIMSNVMLEEVLQETRRHIGCLYQLSAHVAELDLIVSLAKISSHREYVKPSFGPRHELKNSLHPIMDLSTSHNPVPNDVTASVSNNFHIITGPNTSGKTVYIKQIVLLQIMAQIGCYVPADKAEFRLADRIFCRIWFGDDMESNASSFILEIREAQYILQMVTPKSLVIMDELCRGTTVDEGTSIAFAICEQLSRSSAFTFFTTHSLYLTRLADLYSNVTNHNFETLADVREGSVNLRLIYTHIMIPGVVSVENYGIALARNSGMSNTLVDVAQQIVPKLTEGMKPIVETENNTNKKGRRCYNRLSEMQKLIEDNKFTEETVLELIQELCNDGSSVPMATTGAAQERQKETSINRTAINAKNLSFANPALKSPSQTDTNVKSKRQSSMSSKIAHKESSNLKNPHGPPDIGNMHIDETSISSIAADVSIKIPRHPLAPKETTVPDCTVYTNCNSQSSSEKSMSIRTPALNFKRIRTPFRKTSVDLGSRESSQRSLLDISFSKEADRSVKRIASHGKTSAFYKSLTTGNSKQIHLTDIDSIEGSTDENEDSGDICDTASSHISQSPEYFIKKRKKIDIISTPPPSTSTECAKISARRKEAEIFKIIEGDQFRETDFYESVMTDDDSVVIVDD